MKQQSEKKLYFTEFTFSRPLVQGYQGAHRKNTFISAHPASLAWFYLAVFMLMKKNAPEAYTYVIKLKSPSSVF